MPVIPANDERCFAHCVAECQCSFFLRFAPCAFCASLRQEISPPNAGASSFSGFGTWTRCAVHVAAQTTYAAGDLPAEIEVIYPPHPLVGWRLKVVGRRRHGQDWSWQVVLPDGTHANLPSHWTDHPGSPGPLKIATCVTRSNPSVLRELLPLLRVLAQGDRLSEARPNPISKGKQHGRAIRTIQKPRPELDPAAVEEPARSLAPRGSECPGPDGSGSTPHAEGPGCGPEKGGR